MSIKTWLFGWVLPDILVSPGFIASASTKFSKVVEVSFLSLSSEVSLAFKTSSDSVFSKVLSRFLSVFKVLSDSVLSKFVETSLSEVVSFVSRLVLSASSFNSAFSIIAVLEDESVSAACASWDIQATEPINEMASIAEASPFLLFLKPYISFFVYFS